jgi:hypothetical protein
MKKLSRERFDAACNFLAAGRPLEWARFRFLFQNGSPDDVVDQLEGYQNSDGGFGHALEPDLRMPGSSVLATTLALQVLHEIRLGPEHEMVRAALAYLLEKWDARLRAWPLVPQTGDEHPHAPWFDRAEDMAERWHNYQANPRAEILGYLWIWDNIVPDSFLCELCEDVADWLARNHTEMTMHDMLCYVALVEHPVLPPDRRAALLPLLGRAAQRLMEPEPGKWHDYCLRPLDLAPTPRSPLAELVGPVAGRELDFLLETQAPDGHWGPAWSWKDRDPEAWAKARREWCGVITLRHLRRLRAWERLTEEEC